MMATITTTIHQYGGDGDEQAASGNDHKSCETFLFHGSTSVQAPHPFTTDRYCDPGFQRQLPRRRPGAQDDRSPSIIAGDDLLHKDVVAGDHEGLPFADVRLGGQLRCPLDPDAEAGV
jgi:hypothetical protein